ncbi:hypothetical protein [Salinibacterium sp. ZJ450]|uniref:type IV toxin-antitoxin system AbiEi family antitoxin domain-containing protein n=1 Tax=Salinibacterium sp. ZJ450 TaxID=2708338 RepID=UPI00141EF9EC|nr:hypothetical protein [Salinibacterium sp. ZJ450]
MADTTRRLTYMHDLGIDADRRQFAVAAARGTQVRVARGVYLSTVAWAALDADERYVARVYAVAGTRRNQPVLSHWSAAAVHGLPIVGDWPDAVHITVRPAAGGRNRNGIVAHAARLADDDVVELNGLLVTSLARTVLDMAATATFMVAVTMADHVLHIDRFGRIPPLLTRTDLAEQFEHSRPLRSHRKIDRVFTFAETRAETPIESVSRVNMLVIGCPRPLLQSPFSDRDGFIGETDFEWRDYATLGEADGDRKYLDAAYRSGRTVEQVMLDEKDREDRLRALPRRFARWRWKIAVRPGRLRAHLAAAGLPFGVPWASGIRD